MKPVYRRADRVSSEIREIIALVLSRFSAEPALGRLTVIHVDLTDDLKVARVLYSVFPGEDPQHYERLLLRYKGLIRREVGKLLRMKWIPDIEFVVPPGMGGGGSPGQNSSDGHRHGEKSDNKRNSSSLMDELEGDR
ncbi:MAG: ribosome-binding factor A [Nitrospirae bacterium]|jgi:ribosome-binding factor A|nr:ribosome-binding factor A [Nitrospirota bacterium]